MCSPGVADRRSLLEHVKLSPGGQRTVIVPARRPLDNRGEMQSALARHRPPCSVGFALQDAALRLPITYFICAQLLDGLSTIMGLVGGLSEVNPLTAGVIHTYGAWGLLLAKIPAIILVLLSAAFLPRRVAVAAAWTCAMLMAGVVASNAALVLSLGA